MKTTPASTVRIRRVPGDFATISLKLRIDTKNAPAEAQKEIWDGIGRAIAASLPPENRAAFLDLIQRELENARATAKPQARGLRK